MAEESVKVIPTSYQEVLALLRSESLRAVEQAIAARVHRRIVEDYSSASTSYTQAEISVSGLTIAGIEALLASQREQIIAFGVGLLGDQAATADEEEFPVGEDQDPSETVEVVGLGSGFGIKYAIFYNFLTNRTLGDLRAFLKQRRIPNHAKFAKELRRVLDEVQAKSADKG